MAINWELGVMPDIVGNALAAFDEGQTRRAYSSLAENPNDPKARAVLYRNDPKAALLWESKRAETQAKQQEQQNNMAKQTAAILRQVKADPSKYPLARQAAIQLGIPAASIPEQYDPQWVDQQDMIYSAFEKDGGQSLTTAMKHAQALGYDLASPEGKQVLAQIMNAGFAKPYVDSDGNQRLYTGFNVQPAPMAAPQGQPTPQPTPQPSPQAGQEAFTPEQFRGLISGLGKDGAARYLQKNRMPVQIATAADYEMLPEGASYIDPNGVSRVKGR